MGWEREALRKSAWYATYDALLERRSNIAALRHLLRQDAPPDDARAENGVPIGRSWWSGYRAFQLSNMVSRFGGALWLDGEFIVKSGSGSAVHIYDEKTCRARPEALPHFACDGKHAKYAPEWAYAVVAEGKARHAFRAYKGTYSDKDKARADAWANVAELKDEDERVRATRLLLAQIDSLED